MTLIKVCGITKLEDAFAAVEAGVDALGFNFYPESPRLIDPEVARDISVELPGSVIKVGVFVDAAEEIVSEISQYLGLDYLQFHGHETPYYCEQFATPYWKAFRLKDERTLALMEKFDPYAYLIDAYQEGVLGGTGQVADWELASKASHLGRIVLAGGIDPDNVKKALAAVRPWCIDACSGIESEPGIKDHAAITELVKRVQEFMEGGQGSND
jgi:phosphoribosylanthranilate isomerase